MHWKPKAPLDVREYRWVFDEAVSSASATISTGTAAVEASTEDTDAVFTVSGGSAGVVQIIELTVEMLNGEIVTAVAYLPIRTASDALGYTARDVCNFSLRKVFGTGEDPSAEAATDALERLNDMLATWVAQGADVGAMLPMSLSSDLVVSDAFHTAIKNNLILQLADNYGMEVSPMVVMNARIGLQIIKAANLPSDRTPAEYY